MSSAKLRLGFYDVVLSTLAASLMLLSVTVQPSEGIIVSYGTRQGPIQAPTQRAARRAVHPIPYREAPAPVWEVIEDDTPIVQTYKYVLPQPVYKPVHQALKQSVYYPGKSAVQFGVKQQNNNKNTLAQQRHEQKFQHKFNKKFAKYSPEKSYPTYTKNQRYFNTQYNARSESPSYF